jgi:hypothetical protein
LATRIRGGPPGSDRIRSAIARSPSEVAPTVAAPTPVGARYSPNSSELDGRRHDVLVGPGDAGEFLERPVDLDLVPGGPPGLDVGDHLVLDRRVHHQDVVAPAERRRRRLREGVHTHDRLRSRLDPADPVGVGGDESALQFVDRLEGAAEFEDLVELRLCGLVELVGQALDDDGPLEQVGVVEQVGLLGEHLLDPQRPLLVPGSRQPERLVPGGELDGPGPGVAGQGHAERLEHDAWHVVLGLRLGEAERVHLHAVAEPAGLRVAHAVALGGDPIPHAGERPHLGGLLDEPHPGVHEEAHRRHHRCHVLGGHLARVPDRVEHPDGARQRVGHLLRGTFRLQ